jgi:hypothetical protein
VKLLPGFSAAIILATTALFPETSAQVLPGSLGFSIEGSFINPTAQSADSILIADNDLTDGHSAGFDTSDAPAALSSTGPTGSAAFQWGTPTGNNYPHASALWFLPLDTAAIAPEQSFELGHLFYRNGTIKSNSGASWVDLALTISFSQPLGLDPISVTFGSELINSPNNNDPVSSADIVSLRDRTAPIGFSDASGNRYHLELTFQVDQNTLDGTLSTQDEFRVFEGDQGRAVLLGRFTTDPAGGLAVPEPSSALLGALGVLLVIRRKR